LLRLLAPHAVEGFNKIRVGRAHDGGYIMLDDFAGIEHAYSLGINGDVSWDLDIAARDINIYQYDHTIEALPETHPRFFWKRIGVEGKTSDDEQFSTLAKLIEQNGHDGDTNLILKCDIEGAEWDMLANISTKVLSQFRQITMEFHAFEELHQDKFFELVRRSIANLTVSHRVIHVHGNNIAPLAVVGGIALPRALELTLVRKSDRTLYLSNELFPTHLDMPNGPSKADFILGSFRF
jgi:hypothetical protein